MILRRLDSEVTIAPGGYWANSVLLVECPQMYSGRRYVLFLVHDSGLCPELDVCDWHGGLSLFGYSDHGLSTA